MILIKIGGDLILAKEMHTQNLSVVIVLACERLFLSLWGMKGEREEEPAHLTLT